MQNSKCLLVLSISLSVNVLATVACRAQLGWPPNGGSVSRQHYEGGSQLIKQPPDLPQMPAYAGKSVFLGAYVQSQGKGWTIYRCRYLAKEDMQHVKDWYQNALEGNGWKLLHASPQILTATHKDGHTCTVIVNEAAPSTGYRTQLFVHYGQAPQASSQ
jgi:hypothetical protein